MRYLSKLGVHDVTIGEGSKGCETTIPYKAYGFYAVAEKYGAKLVDLNCADGGLDCLMVGCSLRTNSTKVSKRERCLLDYRRVALSR